MKIKEKRKHIRRRVDIPVDIRVQDRFYNGWIKNVTQFGASVKTSGSFSVGDDISFYFFRENKIGTVIWVGPSAVGVKFREP